jgi:uncharacterized protein YjiS (DUF1127 family)
MRRGREELKSVLEELEIESALRTHRPSPQGSEVKGEIVSLWENYFALCERRRARTSLRDLSAVGASLRLISQGVILLLI